MDFDVQGVYRFPQHNTIICKWCHCSIVAKNWTNNLSQPFEELQSSNLESKLNYPKYITGTYFGVMVAILDFCDVGVGP